ncbi:NUDIX hydrolase [Arthrobacter sp. zg-Y20]|uniref:NUDIX domain-containing protein n=1 Tax=unclassified Arthrobacter TaxID=235627 RepID=UPI001D140ABF|nr:MULTISPECIES: NUDIX hydrolase [unclassified Arthrobacter]MCC3274264.1 NUDIX hydrolase [Arthrobacter sp. zg-Y20]MDK1314420.1 NUDIX hydrolase [Arthrobacter sp. zg.Y20]WIB07411.1 NUDIX hydrolase [Arthrobacter sp. zg-Y20]
MARTEGFADEQSPRPLLASETVYSGPVWDVVKEKFTLTDGGEPLVRDYITHPGAVAILAMNDAGQVLLINQYRHPVRMTLWEIPAGLLDVEGEDFQVGAARELAEEADLVASEWQVLTDLFLSPGSSREALRIYLARGISEVPEAERHIRTHEEAEIKVEWVDLDVAVEAALQGRMHSASAVAAVLAAAVARGNGFRGLRAANAPWPEHHSQHSTWANGPVR